MQGQVGGQWCFFLSGCRSRRNCQAVAALRLLPNVGETPATSDCLLTLTARPPCWVEGRDLVCAPTNSTPPSTNNAARGLLLCLQHCFPTRELTIDS